MSDPSSVCPNCNGDGKVICRECENEVMCKDCNGTGESR